MNKGVKKQWVKALRSGEYKQGEGRLAVIKEGGTVFCCLGVLCDLAVKAGIIKKPKKVEIYSGADAYVYEEYSAALPPAVKDWAGLDSKSPQVSKGALIGLNDSGMRLRAR